ncbi:LysR substrate-binding domain-containing protein [Microbacterium sp. NPDC057650]|uniref:LysR substrate-binding domain-containing protein n=1 Tax=unclassified Microbacterium TaxID=2609290 RepID=UPI00366CDFB5
MAKKSGRPAPGKRPSGGRGKPTGKAPTGKKAAPAKRPKPKKVAPREVVAETPRAFRLGAIPGATPGKWIDAWKTRMPHVDLELVPIEVAGQRAALTDLDAALVRLPIDRPDDLHVIRLYDELPVVVASAESHLMAAETLTAADLDGEVLVTPLDDVLGPLDLPTVAPRFAPVATTEDAVATVATGTGVVVMPMSLARMHHRKDANYRVLEGGPTSAVALAWLRDRTTPDVEAFVGIVRGRTANSSR